MEKKTIAKREESDLKKELITHVQNRIDTLVKEGHLHFPKNYSASNALQSAWQTIQKTNDANICTQESISKAMLDTVVQGLNPGKQQVYYIVYGNELKASRSYFGTMAVLKRLAGIKDVYADVVYKNDIFEATKKKGNWHIEKHESEPENINTEEIRAAYCTIELEDGKEYTELMNMKQIQKSWSKSVTKQGVHKDFPDQMAKRTVINRACKYFVNTSDDSDLIIEAFNETGERYENEVSSNVKEKKESERIASLNEEIETARKAEAKLKAVDITEENIKTVSNNGEGADAAEMDKESKEAEEVNTR